MSLYTTNLNIEDVYTSEEDKNKFEYLQKVMDYGIAKLVYEKRRIRKSRNLYEGVRDRAEFKYLEETFGIETPIAVKMTPLIKTRIDVLVGIMLDEVFTYRVSVNDANTLQEIEEHKKNEKAKLIIKKYREALKRNTKNLEKGKDVEINPVDAKYLKKVEDMITEDFVSQFEIAAQSLLKFFEQDITIDLKQKMKQYFLDFLVTGEAYYRTYVPQVGADPVLEICKPENIFYTKNTNHQFVASGMEPNTNMIVHREYLRREEILTRYGHLMNERDKEDLFGRAPSSTGHTNIVNSAREIEYNNRFKDGYGDVSEQYTYNGTEYLPVYHVEWLANNK